MHFSRVIWLYPATFILTIPLNLLLEQYRSLASENWLVLTVNEVFVKDRGYFWFTLVYFSYIFLYQSNWRVPTKKVVYFGGDYLLNTVVLTVLLVWFGGPLIFERVNVATGGHCQERKSGKGPAEILGNVIDPGTLGEVQCGKLGYQWVNGFDCSGHFYLLVSVSLLVWRNFLLAQPVLVGGGSITDRGIYSVSEGATDLGTFSDGNSDLLTGLGLPGLLDAYRGGLSTDLESLDVPAIPSKYMLIYRKFVIGITLFFLLVWYFLFLITCIFFHTISEKVVGIALGLAVPLYLVRREQNVPSSERAEVPE